jgi:hypothetical protein
LHACTTQPLLCKRPHPHPALGTEMLHEVQQYRSKCVLITRNTYGSKRGRESVHDARNVSIGSIDVYAAHIVSTSERCHHSARVLRESVVLKGFWMFGYLEIIVTGVIRFDGIWSNKVAYPPEAQSCAKVADARGLMHDYGNARPPDVAVYEWSFVRHTRCISVVRRN